MRLSIETSENYPYHVQIAIAIRKPGTFLESCVVTSLKLTSKYLPFHYLVAPGNIRKKNRTMKRQDWYMAYRIYRLKGDRDIFKEETAFRTLIRKRKVVPKIRKIKTKKEKLEIKKMVLVPVSEIGYGDSISFYPRERLLLDIKWGVKWKVKGILERIEDHPVGTIFKKKLPNGYEYYYITRNTGTQLFGMRNRIKNHNMLPRNAL